MLRSYIKIAWKVLLRRKFFTFISLFGISFTLLVLMTATALMDHVFAPQASEPNSARTLYVQSMSMMGPNNTSSSGPGYGFLDRWVRTLPDVERVSLVTRPNRMPIYHEGKKIVSFFRYTDGAFWEIMGFQFLEGQAFTEEDDRSGNRVIVINESTRERYFQGQPAVGRHLEIDGLRFRIIGVVQDVPLTRFSTFSEIWAPVGTMKGDSYKRSVLGEFQGIILAHDQADFPAIKAEFASRLERVELPDPARYEKLAGGADTLFESFSRSIFSDNNDKDYAGRLRAVVVVAMLLFMLLPTVNLVNINLSRILERSSEIGVRKAFGASSRTLVGQFVMENVILTMVGAVLGLLMSWIALTAFSRSGAIPYAVFTLNGRIFLYGLLIAVFFGVFSGVYPAWRMSRLHPADALRGRTA